MERRIYLEETVCMFCLFLLGLICLTHLGVCFLLRAQFRVLLRVQVMLMMTNLMSKNSSFNDRLKKLGCQQLNHLRNKNKVKNTLSETCIDLPKNPTLEVFDQMRAEIAALSRRLHESEAQRNKWQEEVEELTVIIREKNMQANLLSHQLLQSQNAAESLRQRLEAAESELENMRLRQKMEAISQELTKEQPASSPIRHQKHKQGRFSAATLPSPFGSQKKFEFRQTELPREDSKAELPSHSILRSHFSGYLIDEWQRSKDERNNKELQVANLESKLAALRKEVARQTKEIQTLKSRKPSGGELVAALEENRQLQRRNKIIFMKLRESEKKRREMAAILKDKGETVEEEDKFYGFSTLADINEMIEKSVQDLQMDRNVVELSISNTPHQKEHASSQTQDTLVASDRLAQLESVIQQLSNQLADKQEQFKIRQLQTREQFQSQVDQYALEIQSLNRQIQTKSIAQKQHMNTSFESTAVDCQLISSDKHQEHQHILEQVSLLIQLNQQLTNKLNAANTHNCLLTQQLQQYCTNYPTKEASTQSQQQAISLDQEETSQCPSCMPIININFQLKEQTSRLNRVIGVVTEEREHFRHCYEETLTWCKDMENQTAKLRQQIEDKEHSLGALNAELMEKSTEIDRYRCDASLLEARMRQLEELREKWELQASRI